MNSMKRDALLGILNSFDVEDIGLPSAPTHLLRTSERAESIMKIVESELGKAADSDYFKCSKERFSHVINLALAHMPPKGKILDVGNAPGYLGIALYNAGFLVDGINLSDAWNSTYPNPIWLERFSVKALDIEKARLPFADESYDAIVFTEVLEHIAIAHPGKILPEFKRVLKKGGVVLFSTPNVCNLSNIIALASGINIFWSPDIFYGSMDRHNREYTPREVRALFEGADFETVEYYGINDHANWRTGAAADIYSFIAEVEIDHPLLRNTIVGAFRIN